MSEIKTTSNGVGSMKGGPSSGRGATGHGATVDKFARGATIVRFARGATMMRFARGATMVEFAILAFSIVICVFAVFEFGRFLTMQNELQRGAQSGLTLATVLADFSKELSEEKDESSDKFLRFKTAKEQVQQRAISLPNQSWFKGELEAEKVTYSFDPADPELVGVTIESEQPFFFPMLGSMTVRGQAYGYRERRPKGNQAGQGQCGEITCPKFAELIQSVCLCACIAPRIMTGAACTCPPGMVDDPNNPGGCVCDIPAGCDGSDPNKRYRQSDCSCITCDPGKKGYRGWGSDDKKDGKYYDCICKYAESSPPPECPDKGIGDCYDWENDDCACLCEVGCEGYYDKDNCTECDPHPDCSGDGLNLVEGRECKCICKDGSYESQKDGDGNIIKCCPTCPRFQKRGSFNDCSCLCLNGEDPRNGCSDGGGNQEK